jgi:hypothetical protein
MESDRVSEFSDLLLLANLGTNRSFERETTTKSVAEPNAPAPLRPGYCTMRLLIRVDAVNTVN